MPLKNIFFRFALSIVKSVEVAEDVTQEVLIKIWEKGDNIENFKAWGMKLTRNLALDKLKSSHAKVVSISDKMQMFTNSPTPLEISSLNNYTEIVNNTLKLLPEIQGLCWQLREIEGYEYTKIAKNLNISIEQVKVNLHRARKAMKQKLKKVLNETS